MASDSTPQIKCLFDKLVKIKDLQSHPKNRNKHPEDQISRLASIIKYQGFRYPIKVSKLSGYVTSGHGRIEAAKLNGWKEVPVNFQDYDSEEQEYADVQADNAIASWAELDLSGINSDIGELGPDFDINLLGIKDFVVEPADKLDPQCDEDEVPEYVEPKTKLGDIYRLGNHRLMCGDSASIDAVERLMDSKKVDVIFTDPPYNVASHSTNYTTHISKGMDLLSKSEWDKDCNIEELLSNILLITKPAFTAYIWTSQFLIQRIWDLFKDTGYVSYLVWNKLNPMPSMSKRHPAWNTELCVYIATEGKERIYNHIDGENFLSCRSHSRVSDGSHPTMKPVDLIEPIILSSSNKGSLVADLFGGSGSTLIACEKTNRKCFMMELDPHYCDVIVARWEKYTGKKADLIS